MCSSLKRVGLSLTPFRTVMMPWYSSSLSLFEACDRDLTQARMGHPGHGVPQKRQEHAWTLETERKGHSSSVPPCGQDAVMAPIICFVQERVSQVFGDLDSSPWGSSLCTVLVP